MSGQISANRLAEQDRIVNLDVLRGLAILAILFMNIPYMAGYGTIDTFDPRLISWTLADRIAFGFTHMIDGTMRGLLQILFGAGMMVALRHCMSPDGPVGPLDAYMRRNLCLIVFGAFHALVLMWAGDILLIYGLTALFLPPFRHLAPARKLLLGALVTIGLTVGYIVPEALERKDMLAAYRTATMHEAAHAVLTKADKEALEAFASMKAASSFPPGPETAKAMQEEASARRGSMTDYWRLMFNMWNKLLLDYGELWWGLLESLGAMLIGAALYGWGVIQGQRTARFYAKLLAACYGCGFLVRAIDLHRVLAFKLQTAFHAEHFLFAGLAELARLPISVGHVALVALLVKSATGWRLAQPLVANGKLPISTYFSASIACLILFPGFAFNLWGHYGPAGQVAIASGVIAAQIVAANLWLRGHVNGPAEWLWKSLSYARCQPYRRPASAPVLVTGPAE